MRRSTRRKRGRGEKQFVVSSDTLLRDLKVQVTLPLDLIFLLRFLILKYIGHLVYMENIKSEISLSFANLKGESNKNAVVL